MTDFLETCPQIDEGKSRTCFLQAIFLQNFNDIPYGQFSTDYSSHKDSSTVTDNKSSDG
jgi:hypothetical protein